VRLLLDTQVLIWTLNEPSRLSVTARSLLQDLRNELWFSPASIQEIAIKSSAGKLKAPEHLLERLDGLGYRSLNVTPMHAWRAGNLPLIHRDPFDRLIVAQALSEDVALITSDRILPMYGVRTLRA
jgi:PIN domain nuclease of toxin-antitoxin system